MEERGRGNACFYCDYISRVKFLLAGEQRGEYTIHLEINVMVAQEEAEVDYRK